MMMVKMLVWQEVSSEWLSGACLFTGQALVINTECNLSFEILLR